MPPKTIEDLRKRAEGNALEKTFPQSKIFRNTLYAVIVLIIIASGLFALRQMFSGHSDVTRVEPSPAQIELNQANLYADEPNSDGTWAVYDPHKPDQKQFWIAFYATAKVDVVIDKISVNHLFFDDFFTGYKEQEYKPSFPLSAGNAVWVGVPIEIKRWNELSRMLSSSPIIKVYGLDGKELGSVKPTYSE